MRKFQRPHLVPIYWLGVCHDEAGASDLIMKESFCLFFLMSCLFRLSFFVVRMVACQLRPRLQVARDGAFGPKPAFPLRRKAANDQSFGFHSAHDFRSEVHA